MKRKRKEKEKIYQNDQNTNYSKWRRNNPKKSRKIERKIEKNREKLGKKRKEKERKKEKKKKRKTSSNLKINGKIFSQEPILRKFLGGHTPTIQSGEEVTPKKIEKNREK